MTGTLPRRSPVAQLVHPVHGELEIPGGIATLKDFRKWVHSNRLPEEVRAHFFNGVVWLDLSMEELASHNFVKTAIALALVPLLKASKLGFFSADGMLLTNDAANLATAPDGMVILHASLAAKSARLVSGKRTASIITEINGSPDLVIEVVSAGSEQKDLHRLMKLYHTAGIREYWIVDARGSGVQFTIHRNTRKKYVAQPRQAGWVHSEVVDREFRFTVETSSIGLTDYCLEVR